MALYKTTRSVILVRRNDRESQLNIYEAPADGAVRPGDILEEQADGTVRATVTDDYEGACLIAIEIPYPAISDIRAGTDAVAINYADEETVFFVRPQQGDIVQVRATAAVLNRAVLATHGADTAGEVVTQATPVAGSVLLQAVEAQPTPDTLFKAEVL